MNDNTYGLWIHRELDDAISNGRVDVYYQPKVCSSSGEIVGLEALARWWHQSVGAIPVSVFIDIAEGSSLIGRLGEYIISKVLWQMSEWEAEGYDYGSVSVNVSPKQLTLPEYVSSYRRLALLTRRYGIDPSKITLELTERVHVTSNSLTMNHLNTLRDLGIKLSLDDFGSGYSSFAYLDELPIDELKLDKSLIRNITSSEKARILLRHLFALTEELNMSVVVEGIEEEAQADILRGMFTGQFQGYLFHKPMSAEEITSKLKSKATA